ncbi:phenol 2-monooxygenase (NADPH), partial [Lecanoromycetidae sp. Uapishka_2]
MQDCYNLGWKIGAVIKGQAKPTILETYEAERRTIAQELIAFDHRFSRLFSGRPAQDTTDDTGISVEEFKAEFEKSLLFASGLSVEYGPSELIAKPRNKSLPGDDAEKNATGNGQPREIAASPAQAANIKLGMRFPSSQVLNQSDASPWQFSRLLKSDGRWRIVLFAGRISNSTQLRRVSDFCAALDSPSSFLHEFTPSTAPIDSAIEILTIHSADRQATDLLSLPELLHPFDEEVGWSYEKVFVDDWSYHKGHGKAYEKYGIDVERGCAVVLRPDQYVGWIGELEDVGELAGYFEGILLPQR